LPLGKVHLDIARANSASADLDISIRNELRTLREEAEKFRFWLPEGVGINPEALANWWVSLDYTGRTTISPDGLVGVDAAPGLKEGQQPLTLDKKLEAELRSRADVPDVISKLRRMAALGNMEQGRITPFSLGFVATTPATTAGAEASSSVPVEEATIGQQLLDNADSGTSHILQDQIPQDEAVNSTALGQNEPMAAGEQGTVGFVQIDLPSPNLTAGGDAPNPIYSMAEVNALPSCELVDSPAGSDPETNDTSSSSGVSESFTTSGQDESSETLSTSDHGLVTS
jgi:hypothetical protein